VRVNLQTSGDQHADGRVSLRTASRVGFRRRIVGPVDVETPAPSLSSSVSVSRMTCCLRRQHRRDMRDTEVLSDGPRSGDVAYPLLVPLSDERARQVRPIPGVIPVSSGLSGWWGAS
jgi:hypothetical protein